jgi:hypothetical protein
MASSQHCSHATLLSFGRVVWLQRRLASSASGCRAVMCRGSTVRGRPGPAPPFGLPRLRVPATAASANIVNEINNANGDGTLPPGLYAPWAFNFGDALVAGQQFMAPFGKNVNSGASFTVPSQLISSAASAAWSALLRCLGRCNGGVAGSDSQVSVQAGVPYLDGLIAQYSAVTLRKYTLTYQDACDVDMAFSSVRCRGHEGNDKDQGQARRLAVG